MIFLFFFISFQKMCKADVMALIQPIYCKDRKRSLCYSVGSWIMLNEKSRRSVNMNSVSYCVWCKQTKKRFPHSSAFVVSRRYRKPNKLLHTIKLPFPICRLNNTFPYFGNQFSLHEACRSVFARSSTDYFNNASQLSVLSTTKPN